MIIDGGYMSYTVQRVKSDWDLGCSFFIKKVQFPYFILPVRALSTNIQFHYLI